MKFSIIIPVFNVEKYIEKCLKSVQNQTFKDFEVIVVNDGSPDNSQAIIDKYVKEDNRFLSILKENGGLSDARNVGIQNVKGDYIFFLDSDDYIDEDLFEKVNKEIIENDDVEIIRIPKRVVDEENNILQLDKIKTFRDKNGEEAFIKIRNNKITLETAWSYFYNKKFWGNNKFEFAKGRLHEDIGLIPFVLISSSNVSAISNTYYNYLQRENSIINTRSYSKDVDKAYDMLAHYDFLMKKISELSIHDSLAKREYKQYIIDAVFSKRRKLNFNDKKQYSLEIKDRHMLSQLKFSKIKNLIKKAYYWVELYVF